MTSSRPTTSTAVLLVAGALAAGGCLARKTPAITYYTLHVPPPRARTVPAAVEVSLVTAEPGYTGTRMATRPSPYRIDYSTFRRWVAPPPAMIASVIEEYLVAIETRGAPRRVLVHGTLRQLESVAGPDGWTAALALTLVAEVDGRPVLERAYDEHEPVAGDDSEDAAAALSAALARVLDDFTTALVAALRAG